MAAQDSFPAPAHEAIIATWRLPVRVQERFLRFPELLCRNPHLAPSVWDELWRQTHTSQDQARELAARPLGPEQAATVVASEHRFDVLCWFVAFNDLSDAQIRAVVESCDRPSALASAILEDGGCSLQAQRWLASRLEGRNALVWAAYRSDGAAMSDDETVELVADKSNPEERAFGQLVDRVFENRPHLVARVASTDTDLRVRLVLAASRFASTSKIQMDVLGVDAIDDPAQWASPASDLAATMAKNPMCTASVAERLARWHRNDTVRKAAQARLRSGTVPEPYETVDLTMWFETMFTWVQERKAPFDVLAMLTNPTLTQDQATRLLRVLAASPASAKSLVDQGRIDEVLGAVSLRFPTSGVAAHLMARHSVSVPFFERNLRSNYDRVEWRDRLTVAPDQLRTQNVWMAPNAAAALVTDVLGDDPDLWEMFLGLAERHTGTLEECAVAARYILT